MNWHLVFIAFAVWFSILVIGMKKKKRWKRFSKNIMSLNLRTLLAISLVLIALDTLTAFLNYKITPDTFVRFEQNELIRRAFTAEDIGSYLVAEANAITFIVAIFAVSVWTRWGWPRFALLLCPMMLALAAFSNVVGMAVLPNGAMFITLMLASALIVVAIFLNPRSLRWLQK